MSSLNCLFSEIMSTGKALIICVVVSGCYAPIVHFALSHHYWSQKYTMLFLDYFLFAVSFLIFVGLLEPCSDFWNFEKRGSVFYFSCCMFTCIAVNQFTLNAVRFKWIKVHNRRIDFFYEDEPYIQTPHGICSEMWQCFFTFSSAILMILKMENGSNPRNTALYWCGAILSGEIVTAFGLLFGTHKKRTKYSSFVHYFYLPFTLVVLHHFLVSKSPSSRKRHYFKKSFAMLDIALVVFNAICMLFQFLRFINVIDMLFFHPRSKSVFQSYVRFYEPYATHQSHFGLSWVLLSTVISIPCHLYAIHYLTSSDMSDGISLAMMHAGCTLYGTVVYLSYDFVATSQKPFRIPKQHYTVVMTLNFILVCSTHCYMLRCLWAEQLKKIKAKMKSKLKCRNNAKDYDDYDDDDADDMQTSSNKKTSKLQWRNIPEKETDDDECDDDDDVRISLADSDSNWASSDSDCVTNSDDTVSCLSDEYYD